MRRSRNRSEDIHPVIIFLHDQVWFTILAVTSPAFREHQRFVKLQRAHLRDALHADAPEPGCTYCDARVAAGYFDR